MILVFQCPPRENKTVTKQSPFPLKKHQVFPSTALDLLVISQNPKCGLQGSPESSHGSFLQSHLYFYLLVYLFLFIIYCFCLFIIYLLFLV